MAVEVQFLFWPSVILSVAGSIILTLVFYFLSKRNPSWLHDDFYDQKDEKSESDESDKSKEFGSRDREYDTRENREFDSHDGDSFSNGADPKTQIKTGGVIFLGPIPIAFGNGGIRFDQKNLKYALLFFLIAVLVYLAMSWILSK